MKAIFICCLICLPLRNLQVTSPFGYRTHPVTGKYSFHGGVELRASHDTVYAIMTGTVEATGFNDLLGIYIRLGHDSLQAVYGHLSQVFVGADEQVEAGDPIGITGATGRVTGEHLHLGLLYGNHYINPIKFFYQMLIKKNYEQQQQ
jgi:murein DD-endopeptidase MepM/ murein hydrolase activator NlpD